MCDKRFLAYVAGRRPKFPMLLDNMLIGEKAYSILKELAKKPFVKKKCEDPLEDFLYNKAFKSKEKKNMNFDKETSLLHATVLNEKKLELADKLLADYRVGKVQGNNGSPHFGITTMLSPDIIKLMEIIIFMEDKQ